MQYSLFLTQTNDVSNLLIVYFLVLTTILALKSEFFPTWDPIQILHFQEISWLPWRFYFLLPTILHTLWSYCQSRNQCHLQYLHANKKYVLEL